MKPGENTTKYDRDILEDANLSGKTFDQIEARLSPSVFDFIRQFRAEVCTYVGLGVIMTEDMFLKELQTTLREKFGQRSLSLLSEVSFFS